jgi:hypothetical protein
MAPVQITGEIHWTQSFGINAGVTGASVFT